LKSIQNSPKEILRIAPNFIATAEGKGKREEASGNAEIILLSRVNLPFLESYFDFHPESL